MICIHLSSLDLYDAFIESNKKEDASERMWSIRSVVSNHVYSFFKF